jgi:uncharacterized membrane protein YagU involved in acid resistance
MRSGAVPRLEDLQSVDHATPQLLNLPWDLDGRCPKVSTNFGHVCWSMQISLCVRAHRQYRAGASRCRFKRGAG